MEKSTISALLIGAGVLYLLRDRLFDQRAQIPPTPQTVVNRPSSNVWDGVVAGVGAIGDVVTGIISGRSVKGAPGPAGNSSMV